jgi:SAM-dependent methyltransferase
MKSRPGPPICGIFPVTTMQYEYAAQYGDLERWHWWFLGRRRILESVLGGALGPAAAGRRIVSVGCGPPASLDWLVPFAGEKGVVVGLDADPSGALRVPGAGRAPAGIELVIGALEAAPLRSRSCDAVLALDVLEHLDDDVRGLEEAARLVAPGGLLLVTVPALPSLWGNQDVVNQHRRRYTRRALAEIFQRVGLPAPRLSFFNTLLFPPIAAVRWGRRLLGSVAVTTSDFEGARPGALNNLLAGLFAAERHVLQRASLPVGVSLMAVSRAQAPRA